MGRGRPRLAAAIFAVILTAGATWSAAERFQSPEQREAAASAPESVALMEPVKRGDLVDEVQAPCTLRFARSDVLLPARLPDHAVVTASAAIPGSTLRAGDMLLELNGRPIIVVESPFDFYRDLASGAEGPDVVQLQQTLTAAGHAVERKERGTFGASTTQALRALYADHGYRPISALEDRDAVLLPLMEVVIAPRLPAQVSAVLSRGEHPGPDSGLATAGAGQLIAHADVPNAIAARLSPGLAATMTLPGAQTSTGLRVTSIEDLANGDAQSLTSITLTPESVLPVARAGASCHARITIKVIARSALLLPTRAVARTPTGATSVLRLREGHLAPISVEILGSIGGLTAVTTSTAGGLVESDKVKVG
jgi:peptidoglycan hydrolase-like protein with peptidoglycan-binding domain